MPTHLVYNKDYRFAASLRPQMLSNRLRGMTFFSFFQHLGKVAWTLRWIAIGAVLICRSQNKDIEIKSGELLHTHTQTAEI